MVLHEKEQSRKRGKRSHGYVLEEWGNHEKQRVGNRDGEAFRREGLGSARGVSMEGQLN